VALPAQWTVPFARHLLKRRCASDVDVCLFVAYIGPKSRTEKLRKI